MVQRSVLLVCAPVDTIDFKVLGFYKRKKKTSIHTLECDAINMSGSPFFSSLTEAIRRKKQKGSGRSKENRGCSRYNGL